MGSRPWKPWLYYIFGIMGKIWHKDMTSASCLQFMHFMWRTYKKRGPKYPKETQYRVIKRERTTSYIYRTSRQFHSFVVIREQQNRAFIFKRPWTSKYLKFNRECQSHPFYMHSVALDGRQCCARPATLLFQTEQQKEAASLRHYLLIQRLNRQKQRLVIMETIVVTVSGGRSILQCSHAAEHWTTHCSSKMKKQKQTF